ncbi:hypothetical protein J3A83DRAFT_4184551 [Scleroderma citrinum]
MGGQSMVVIQMQSSLEDALGSRKVGIDSGQETCLLLNYPPLGNVELLVHPTVVLGNGGTITLWYLLNALFHPTEDTILRSLLPLWNQLASSIVNCSWWTWSQWFNIEDNRLAGCLEFAPASQMQGHTTCFFHPTVSTDLNTELYDVGIHCIWNMT